MSYEIEQDIDIDGIKCSIFLNRVKLEVGIHSWDMDLRGMFMKKLAQRIAEEFKVSFKKQNFGGHSGGNPPRYREVFTVKIGKEGVGWRKYLDPTKEDINELENAKKKLVETVHKLNIAVNKTVSEVLRILKLK